MTFSQRPLEQTSLYELLISCLFYLPKYAWVILFKIFTQLLFKIHSKSLERWVLKKENTQQISSYV